MAPSVKQVMTEMKLQGADAESLRFETRTFLMDQNGHDNAKVARLNIAYIRRLARRFLDICGKAYFPRSGGKCPFVWGEDDEELVKYITMIMVCQSKSKLSKLRSRQEMNEEALETALSSESESEVVRKRLATVDRAYRPGGTPQDTLPPRSYRTRSAIHSDMSIMQSIELDISGSGETCRRKKRRRMTMSAAVTSERSPILAAHVIETARSQQNMVQQYAKAGARISEPIRLVQQGVRGDQTEQPDSHHAQGIMIKDVHVDVPPKRTSSMSASVSSFGSDLQSSKSRIYETTPYPSSPVWGDLHAEQSVTNRRCTRGTVDTVVEPGITVPSARSWDLTPPASSAPDDESNLPATVLSPKRRRRQQTTIEPEDIKFILKYDKANNVIDQIDLTGPETVMIHLGDDNFKVIKKECSVKILQKLIDFYVNSLRVYKRRAHQAPAEGQRKIYSLKAECLSKLFDEACVDEIIWRGGEVDDPTVSML